jgi:murein DD-endopeptidase MepM/ murein hydrolase activator NlpD
MKKSLLAVALLLSAYLSFAQAPLQVHSNEKGLYIIHTVTPKENFYSIGRLYSISPKDIEAFNGIDMSKGLSIGQALKVPLNATNFSQTTQKGVPVVYVVGPNEGLLKVSQKNNNVLLSNLRQWNNLSSDVVTGGKKLIVGYVTAAGQSSPAVAAKETPRQEVVANKPEPQQTSTPKTEVVEKKSAQVAETKPDEERKLAVAQQKVAEKKSVASTTNNQVASAGA